MRRNEGRDYDNYIKLLCVGAHLQSCRLRNTVGSPQDKDSLNTRVLVITLGKDLFHFLAELLFCNLMNCICDFHQVLMKLSCGKRQSCCW